MRGTEGVRLRDRWGNRDEGGKTGMMLAKAGNYRTDG